MRHPRRVTAALLCVLLLQMLGLGSGVLGAARPGAECDMSMASESGASAGEMPMPGDDPRPPCELPWAPRSCVSAAACLPVLPPPVAAPGRTAVVVAHAAVPASDAAAPESPTRAPELPPPRA